MDINLFKLVSGLGLWAVAIICGLLPLLLKDFHTNKLFVSLSQCFAGGLFIAIGLIHILPEARENLEDSWKTEGHDPFPLSYFICLVTFSLILLIDKVLFNNTDIIEEGERTTDLRTSLMRKSILGHKENEPDENFQEMVSHNMKIALSLSQLNLPIKIGEKDDEDQYLEIPSYKAGNFPSRKFESRGKDVEPDKGAEKKEGEQTGLKINEGHGDCKSGHFHNQDEHEHSHGHHLVKKAGGHDHHGHHHAEVKKGASYTSALVILTAMGIHSLFEGLAYGVSTGKEEVMNMFIAIVAHKWCDSLVVSMSFVGAELPLKMSIILTLFLSCFTPLGILIGYLASSNTVVTGIFQALSAGTFLYISCAEIIIEEFAIADKKFIKFLMYSLGILFVTLMGQIEH